MKKKVQKKKAAPQAKPAAERRSTGMRSYMANRIMTNGGY